MALTIPQQLAELIKNAKTKAADGLTWAEARAILNDTVSAGMSIVSVLNEPGIEKKAMLLSYIADLVDFLLAKLIEVLPFYARWVAPYFVPILKQVILTAADAWLEQIYATKFKPA